MMSPLEIEVLFWHYTRPVIFPEDRYSKETVRETLAMFVSEGLINRSTLPHPVDHHGYTVTPRGRVYIDALTSLPLPVQHWIIPERPADAS